MQSQTSSLGTGRVKSRSHPGKERKVYSGRGKAEGKVQPQLCEPMDRALSETAWSNALVNCKSAAQKLG